MAGQLDRFLPLGIGARVAEGVEAVSTLRSERSILRSRLSERGVLESLMFSGWGRRRGGEVAVPSEGMGLLAAVGMVRKEEVVGGVDTGRM